MDKVGKKVLFVATVDSHIELFHLPYLKMFHDKGWEVHVATDTGKKIEYCDKKIKLPIKRSPFKLVSNYKAMRKLREVMKKEGYSIVHCHTPMGGVVARMAGCKLRRQGQRMIYTAHGFHFYKGAPVHYWLMFYPVEWYLAKYTDTLITINNEDYARAKKRFGKRCHDIQYVPGVGVDEKRFKKQMTGQEKKALKRSLGLKASDRVLICVGRLDKNKNQGFLIQIMRRLVDEDSKYHLLLVGPDEIDGEYQKMVSKLCLEGNVHFLGLRKDIPELLQISNVAVSSSKREGLPVNLIEAAMLGLPLVATDCRGNRDICGAKGENAIVGEKNEQEFIREVEKAEKVYSNRDRRVYAANYGMKNVCEIMQTIYGGIA
ncbi:glycosyltransferase family 4 protein [Candidatus Saccharibacteria bacterium]|nr:glycosyltransferase family 4 protein [Candidatus Saccharibacteria bacterium]